MFGVQAKLDGPKQSAEPGCEGAALTKFNGGGTAGLAPAKSPPPPSPLSLPEVIARWTSPALLCALMLSRI